MLNDARFQNSDFVFRQLKPGIILFAYAAKKCQETSPNFVDKDIYFPLSDVKIG